MVRELASRGEFSILGAPVFGPARVTQVVPPSFVGTVGFAALDGQSSSAIIQSAAGKPWRVVSELPGQVVAISFSSPSDGAAITVAHGPASPNMVEGPAMYLIWQTRNGGASWRVLARMPHQTPIAIAAGSGKRLAVATVDAPGGLGQLHLWVSRDGGVHWTELGAADLPDNLGYNLPPFGPSDAALSVTAHGYLLAVAAIPHDLVLASRDGVRWTVVGSASNDDLALTPAFDGETVWWLNNQLIRPGSKANGKDQPPVLQPVLTASPASGNPERTVSLPEGYDALAMAWAGSRGMVVCASSANMDPSQGLTLFVTTDGGATWTARHLAPGLQPKLPGTVVSLALAGDDFGALLTDRGLLMTRDGGWTWAYAPGEG